MARRALAQQPRIVPITYQVADTFVRRAQGDRLNRRGHLFALAAITPIGQMAAVAHIAHPRAWMADDAATADVACLTPADPDVHTQLVRMAWRITRFLGYRRLIHRAPFNADTTGIRNAGLGLAAVDAHGEYAVWEITARPRRWW